MYAYHVKVFPWGFLLTLWRLPMCFDRTHNTTVLWCKNIFYQLYWIHPNASMFGQHVTFSKWKERRGLRRRQWSQLWCSSNDLTAGAKGRQREKNKTKHNCFPLSDKVFLFYQTKTIKLTSFTYLHIWNWTWKRLVAAGLLLNPLTTWQAFWSIEVAEAGQW